ncbi:type 1 fimbrial protein [Salmonella enterica subsp. enterica]|nr:type 1 fimbrial protein [Salmonella enterica subsp. enterica serovar Bispebjerg]EAA5301462.1 type 1 fimbrial protein [Salmonella enterica subsp. enterica serovar Manhattan]ECF6912602.1 type 1 fimbrial protein [Salmonella enterica subsp. enterica]ECM3601159.1 type 1 fimbrial protein [Salmonella enterica subsp. enterica serovar Senftenberg]EDV5640374.1 type 1 fimbrial protein [Salmonella enterica subsp. enterica serovar Salford]EDW1096585.1 type 1 fimbrial protein [Salmonella enterica subsp. 
MRFLKLSLLAALATGACMANAATQGTLTITGNIVDQTCEVDAAQMTRTVDFGDIGKAAITAAAVDGSITSKPLVFDFTKCPASTTDVGIRFDFTPDANHTNYLSNTGTGAGVLLGVTDENDNLEQSGGVVLATNLDKTAGTATVNAKVHAYRTAATDADITAGNIASTATVTINQN